MFKKLTTARVRTFFPRLIGLLLAIAMISLSGWNPVFLQNFRAKAFDALLRHFPGAPGDIPICLVDIDSRSLAEIGQWPWPRTIMAEALKLISEGNPRAIGLDIVYAEPDRTSPRQIAALWGEEHLPGDVSAFLASLPDHDRVLARTLLSTPTIVGYPFTSQAMGGDNEPRNQPDRFAFLGFDPKPWLFSAEQADANLPLFEQSALGSGFFNIQPDNDGLIRSLPLLMSYKEGIYPSLALEMLRADQGQPTVIIRSKSSLGVVAGLNSLKVGAYEVPTDAKGRLRIRYCGQERTFPYISITDVLSGEVKPNRFAGAFVVIGTSAPGLQDLRTTPFSSEFPGMEIHAHALNTIIARSFLLEPDWGPGAERVYLIVVSGLLIFFLPRIGAMRSGLLVLICGVALTGFSLWCFMKFGFLLDMVYPLLSVGSLFTAVTFCNYFVEERQSRQLHDAFSRYLSPVLVNELIRHPERLTLTGEERDMTIVFSDIRNFTTLSEGMKPQELCQFINSYLTPMTRILMDHRAYVDKYIGDAIMAFWNAPLQDTRHAYNGCRAALAMVRALEGLNLAWQARGIKPIAIGVGLHSGPARVGNMGAEHRFSYTVMGDSVNLASRLEGINKLYGSTIVVSEYTRQMVDADGFVFRKLDRVRVKGKKEPVSIYELLGEQGQMTEKTLRELTLHEQAMAAYLAGDFSGALGMFSDLARKQDNVLYRLYTDRCREFCKNPPPFPWDGVTTLFSK